MLEYRDCTEMVLELLAVSGWREVPVIRNCPERQGVIQPGSQVTSLMPMPDDVLAGTYRVRYKVIHVITQDASEYGKVPAAQLMTNVFAVR
jgi:hypothetical protein